LLKVVTQRCLEQDLNPRPTDRKPINALTVTCRLTACTPGSVRGPTLGIDYGKPLPFTFLMSNSPLRRSGMARVNDGSHLPPTRLPQVERIIPTFIRKPQSVIALRPVLIFRPAEGRRLSWPEWLVTNRDNIPAADGHPSQYTNPARCRLTPLIETNALPLSQAATGATGRPCGTKNLKIGL